ncbi:signal peptidase II [Deinococcus multiflagellatus]|uniref:Lipoprotein signal peptidase n=1 Tax=Deinococcus multiflagellatus TaxID=1656887 RepID=A0ABW1ZMF7_9DEIO|nr:signal peptidase II [Deinococcus multiflagellatus]MBZ9716116.1 signal peptidase II [Deinococcus multiflagellatus]
MLRGVPTLTDRSRRTPLWLPLLIVALLVAADQALKAWALATLQPYDPAQPFLPGLLDWQLTFNTGAAWSLFSGSAVPLAVGRLLVGLGLLVYLAVRPQPRLLSVVLAMIAAGAIGNAIDGLRQGRVTDMLHSPLLSSVTRALYGDGFPIFNIADMCVVLGTILLIVLSLLGERRAKASA